MSSYLEAAIGNIYSDGDDFVLLGLSGRTGSGCSTVAKILTKEKGAIVHSLCDSNEPKNNEERKERIILKHYNERWQPFILLQVRSLMTLMLALDEFPEEVNSKINGYSDVDCAWSSIKEKLEEIKLYYNKEILRSKSEELSAHKSQEIINFYNSFLPNACESIKSLLGESNFIALYQYAGKNLRTSGRAFESNEASGKSFIIAEKINEAIKEIRSANKVLQKDTFIVIDAIRNPFEALFFQKRYSSFYLVAISCPDEQRRERLRTNGLTDAQINNIDAQEYDLKDVDEADAYSVQDIQACLQRADIYINNPNSENKVSEYSNLANQLIKFTMLMKRPGLVTPTALERCMQLAYTAKLNSGCISRQVGAAVTDSNYSIRAIGWNDVPYGQVPCNLRNRFDLSKGYDSKAYSKYERNNPAFITRIRESLPKYQSIANGQNTPYCFKSEYHVISSNKDQVHTRSLHAEENAFLQISKCGGAGIDGGFLFTTASPCELCSKKAYQLGIKRIYYIDPYPGIAIDHILNGGSNNPELILFSGAIGRAFHRLYMPITAYKDELSALTKSSLQ